MQPATLDYDAQLDKAAIAVVSDNCELARAFMNRALMGTCDQSDAWLIQAWTCSSLEETEIAIHRCLEIDPSNKTAISGLNWIQGIRKLAETRLQAKREGEQARQAEQAKKQAEAQKKSEDQARAEAKRIADEQARGRAEALMVGEDQACDDATQSTDNQPETLEALASTNWSSEFIESKLKKEIVSLASEVRQVAHPEIVQAPSINDEGTPEDEVAPDKPMVLAVDDSPTIRKLVSLTLSRAGFEVMTAEDGIEALSILAEQRPEIVLSDINMPRLGGYRLCKFIKNHERTKSIPVVMLSGNDGVFDKMRGKLSGCDDFISKPFEAADLIAKIQQHLAAVNNS